MFVGAILTPFTGAECRSLLHFLMPCAISLPPYCCLCCDPNCYAFTGLRRNQWTLVPQKEQENAVINSSSVQIASLRECSHPLPSCPHCRRRILFTSQIVTLSLSFRCFTRPSNLSTQTRGFCMLTHSAGGPGEWILVKMVGQGVRILPWKFQPISSMLTPWKSLISLLFGMAPSPGDFLLSTLAPTSVRSGDPRHSNETF